MNARPFLLVALAACVDAASPPPPPPASGCTDGPTETVGFSVRQVALDGSLEPLVAPVEVTFDGCASAKPDASGYGSALVGAHVPRSVWITGEDMITTIFPERVVPSATADENFFVFPAAFAANAPSYSADKGQLVVTVQTTADGSCGRPDGVTVAIKNHPELAPVYLATAVRPAAAATATTAYGVAVFPDVPPDDRYEVVASKPGCIATTLDAEGIGLVPTAAGAVSVVAAKLTPPTCGPGPYAQMRGTVQRRALADYSTSVIAGVHVTWSACPGVEAITDAAGRWQVQLTAGTPFDLSLAKAGVIPYRFNEVVLTGDVDGTLVMRGDEWKPYHPGWSDTEVSIFALIGATGTGACATGDGVTVGVHDHPEAVVHYLDTAIPPQEVAGATATTIRSYAQVSGLPGGRYQLDVTTSKNCKLTNDRLETGFVDAVPGSQNTVVVLLGDP